MKTRNVHIAALITAALGLGAINHTTQDAANPAMAGLEQSSSTHSIAQSMIVRGTSVAEVVEAVRTVGGEITHELGIINSVAAELTHDQLAALNDHPAVRSTFADGSVSTAAAQEGGEPSPYGHYPAQVGADVLHAQGYTGSSVTVAVVDSGMHMVPVFQNDTQGVNRMANYYNAIFDIEGTQKHRDNFGHGTHMTSIIWNTDYADDGSGRFNSMAPDVTGVSVKAFNSVGNASYANVIRGLDWLLSHKDAYNIRVVNLSFGAEAKSPYWEDPINQAVMRLWQAGVVVVVSAGNTGPDPMTIGVPGNNPYVITVGAMTDSYTPDDPSDDVMTTFSSAGPTHEGFVKPEVVAPGGHVVARSRYQSRLATDHPEYHDQDRYFTMSGTSQAAAVVTGTVALMLDAKPWLTPDDVKCQLLQTARPAVDADGFLAYSPFRQGAGLIDAVAAVADTSTGCANQGMDIQADLDGLVHYTGPARADGNNKFYVLKNDGSVWNEGSMWNEGSTWNESSIWNESSFWNESSMWNESSVWNEGSIWNEASFWNESSIWNESSMWNESSIWNESSVWNENLTEPMSVNVWVEQE